MNANSLPLTPAIKDWLNNATDQLIKVGIDSARLDAEIILANNLRKDRTYIHAHPDEIIDQNTFKTINGLIKERLNRVPIAYLIGKKEFYGREFVVTPATLIPRPESEDIIEILTDIITNQFSDKQNIKLVDVGTGSGCLGITAKLTFPNINVTLTDISNDALKIAERNADNLLADVNIVQSNLLDNYNEKPNIIIANLPYVDENWFRSPETNFEPSLALFADNNGLALIEKLIDQSNKLLPNGFLIIESDPRQHESIKTYTTENGFIISHQSGYIIAFEKVK